MRPRAIPACLVFVVILAPGASLPVESVLVLAGGIHEDGTSLTWVPVVPVPDGAVVEVWRKVGDQETRIAVVPPQTNAYLDASIFPLAVVEYHLKVVSGNDVIGFSNLFVIARPAVCSPLTWSIWPPDAELEPQCIPP